MKKCVILGGTGYIGQQFIRLLENHPKLELVDIYASSRTSGKKISDIWNLPFYTIPDGFEDMEVRNIDQLDSDFDFAFSGLPASIAKELEPKLAGQGIGVFSNASANRMNDLVPILIPEINGPQANSIQLQSEQSGSQGFIITNANCSVTGLAMYLSEIRKVYDFHSIVVSTYQAMSGAGNKGVGGIEITGNVIPFIRNEEEKIAIEANKILGSFDGTSIIPDKYEIIANCARVPTIDGHLEAITLSGNQTPDLDKIRLHLTNIQSPLQIEDYYTAPRKHIEYLHEENRPQPAIDANRGENNQKRGMTLYTGRMRSLGKTLSSYVLVHNTIRGGAGGSLLNAEYVLNKNIA